VQSKKQGDDEYAGTRLDLAETLPKNRLREAIIR
jgi:hypothetical protein